MLYKLQLAYYKRKLAYLIMAADEIGKPDVNNIFDLLQINQEKERTCERIETLVFKKYQKQDKYYSRYKKALICLCFALIGTILKKKVNRHG